MMIYGVAPQDLRKAMDQRAQFMARRNNRLNRRWCFVSYHVDDKEEVKDFIDSFGSEIIFKCLGVTDNDNFVDSEDEETIRRAIREKYLANTTVTIVLVGTCTRSRKFVDWEISSSLRDDPRNKRSGIVAIPLPSLDNKWRLPERLLDNYDSRDSNTSYVVGRPYPTSAMQLREYVEIAISKRDNGGLLINNQKPLMRSNLPCC